MTARRSESLQTILGRRLIIIAAAVILANVLLVAYFDASDRASLISDVSSRELANLESALNGTDPNRETDLAGVSEIYTLYPDAYAFAILGPDGRLIDGANVALFPAGISGRVPTTVDWRAWPEGPENLPMFASHALKDDPEGRKLVFMFRSDPANLIGWEIWDEFLGHVLLPLLPITIVLIGGAWLLVRQVLLPVAEAADWARSIRPGYPVPAFPVSIPPAEIEDLTGAVQRSVDRLKAELDAEQRRAGEAAHALRTPVAVLVARLDELGDGPEMAKLRADVLALSRTVTQFLSSAGADRLEIAEDARAELNQIVAEVVADLAPLALQRGAEIEVDGAQEPCVVHGTRDAISLALTNLVENAIYHGGKASITVTVGPGPQITVRDRGPGLPEDAPEMLFKPFWRGPDAARGGAGLGLAIVDRIQRSHGGQVEASNAHGGGAEFRLLYRAA